MFKFSTRTSSITPEFYQNRPFKTHIREWPHVAIVHLHAFFAHIFFISKQFWLEMKPLTADACRLSVIRVKYGLSLLNKCVTSR